MRFFEGCARAGCRDCVKLSFVVACVRCCLTSLDTRAGHKRSSGARSAVSKKALWLIRSVVMKLNSLTTAVIAGIAGVAGIANMAGAVNLNPDGLGQVLIYPYYTVRADANGHDFNSLLSVVNTTASVKAVKVRILEGRNSVEVLDFNLYLSPKDVWAAAITPTADGAGGQITSPDKSCTLPLAVSQGQTIAFRNTAYTTDGAGSTLDRTKEGYVEIIEMATYADSSTTAINATHVNGVPPGCSKITDAAAGAQALPPTGGLFGGMTLINVDSG